MQRIEAYLASKQGLWTEATLKSVRSRLKTCYLISDKFEPKELFESLSRNHTKYTIKQTLVIASTFEKTVLGRSRIEKFLKENSFVFRNCYRTKTHLITDSDYEQMLKDAANRPNLYNMMILMGEAGLRRSEALNAKWSDIVLNIIRVIGKGGKERFIPLNQSKLRKVVDGTPYISGRHNGCHHYFQNISPHTFHDLRSYFATKVAAMEGISLKDVQTMLGHSCIKTTERYLRSDLNSLKKLMIGSAA